MSLHEWYTNTGAAGGTGTIIRNATLGIYITPSKTIKMTALKVKTGIVLAGSMAPRIYKVSDGSLVASGTSVTLGNAGSYQMNINATLLAGVTYCIGVYAVVTGTYDFNVTYGGLVASFSGDGVTFNVTPYSGTYSCYVGGNDSFPNSPATGLSNQLPTFNIVASTIEPNTPTNLTPIGSSGSPSIQTTLTPTLSWSFTDTDTDGSQSAYQVVIKKASDNSIVKDTGKVTSSGNIYVIPAGTLQPGTLYYWAVDVWDNADLKNSTSPTAQYFRTKANPTISGNANEALGNKNTPFAIAYSVNDADSTDVLNVVEKLNDSQINSISNAPRNTNFTINITQSILNSLTLNQQNTIQISVTDGSTTTYKTVTFTRVNSGPSISNSDKDLGQVVREAISEKYTCHDVEGNTFTIVEKVDDIELKNITGVDGTEYTINIPLNIWLALKNGAHTYYITATDSLGASTTRTFIFTKKETVIESTGLTKTIPTDIAATKILLTPSWLGKENADTILFQVCNNANDATPTWEDATSQTLLNKPYTFTNKVKTATKWCIDIKFKITLKAGSTDGIEFYGIGGSLE